jgi:hypothetical protein
MGLGDLPDGVEATFVCRMCLTSSAAQFHNGTKINMTVPRCPYSMSLIAPRVTAPSDASVATE